MPDALLDILEAHSPINLFNLKGLSSVVLICEHASNFIPDAFNHLGLPESDRKSHAAWDLGARNLSRTLSQKLDSTLIEGSISRLLYDCNRPPDAPSAFPTQSERIKVPGNENLSVAERKERTEAIYDPFREAVQSILMRRQHATVQSIVVTIHSFTPVYHGVPRATEIGILHDDDPALALAMMENAKELPGRNVALNQPYKQSDGVTHSLAMYGTANGLPNVMLEVRNDLLTDETEIEAMAQDLLQLLLPAVHSLGADLPKTAIER